MAVGSVVRDQVLGRMSPWSAGGDRRAVRWVAWLVTGLMLEQDARLERIALAMSGPQALASRVRTIRRCLNLSVMLPDGMSRSIAERRRQCGAARYFDSVFVDAHYDAPGASLLQLGMRQVRQDVLSGRAPRVEVALLADDDIRVRGMPGEGRQLKRFHAVRGLPFRERWLPPGSYEARNAMWWLPRGITPRIPIGQPPVLD